MPAARNQPPALAALADDSKAFRLTAVRRQPTAIYPKAITMSSFIANEPTAAPATPDAGLVLNDGFFPSIDKAHMRGAMRLDGTVTDERLVDALIPAIINANAELAEWKAQSIAAGAVDVETMLPQIGGKGVKATLYRTAVYRAAKADLTERYQDFDATKSGTNKAEQIAATVEEDRRAARWAISDIQGKPRTIVELI